LNSKWNWKKAVLGKVNRDYRESFLREDKTQARFLIAIAAVWTSGYFYVDYVDLKLVPLFYSLFTLRIFYLSASIWLFLKLPHIRRSGTVDLAILGWSIAGVLLAFSSNFSRDDISLKIVNSGLAWVLAYYLILPTRHLYKSIPALLVSIFSIYILLNYESITLREITMPVLLSRLGAVIAMNVIGFGIALRLDSQRYHQYLIQKTLIEGRAHLKELATSDSLTGIFNRRSFLEIASTEFDRYLRYGAKFSFAILDVDNLKNINDTYGHPAGDHSIQLLTETITAEKRSSDTSGRLAGDEFGIILPNTSAEKAREVLSRIQISLTDTIVESLNKQQFQVSFSAGVANIDESDKSFDDLYRRADMALLTAKQLGGNRIKKA
jgi:diguanylate cyclase (GGDEF)-like protein